MLLLEGQKGSSLDPSAEEDPNSDRRLTTKMGMDATIPLDKDKNEEMLVKKLLSQHKTEHRQAYIDHRTQLCKAMVFENRKQAAEKQDEIKKSKTQILEEKRIQETKTGETRRHEDIEESRAHY